MIIPQFSLEISANTVAWYGAIVATIAASASIYTIFRDRGRIKISYQKGMRIMNALPPWSEDKDYFMVHITNMGRRPIAIGTVAIRYVGGEAFILSNSLDNQQSRVLTEASPRTMITSSQDEIDFSRIYCISVYDQVGREYRKYFDRVPILRKLLYKIKNRQGI